MKKYIFLLPAAALLFAACTKDIEQRLDKVEADVATISDDLAAANSTIKALQEKVNSAVTVTKVETVADGYKISFSDNTTAVIKNGDAFFESVAVVGNTVEIVLKGTTDKIVLPVYSVKISSVTFVPDRADGVLCADYVNENESVVANYLVYPESASDAIYQGVVNGAYKLSLVGNKVTKALNGKTFEIPQDYVYAGLKIDFLAKDFITFASNSAALLIENTVTGEQILSNFVNISCEPVSFTLGGDSYPVVKMADGKFWTAKNLHYVPDGYTPSNDLTNVTAGVFMPVVSDGSKAVFGEAVVGERGYLYQAECALGVPVGSITTEAQAKALEGARGICAEGWHIPTIDDIIGLVGKAVTPIATNTAAPYYNGANGSIVMLNEDGFNADAFGSVTIQDVTKTSGTLGGVLSAYPNKTSSGYFLGSTFAAAPTNNIQFYALICMTNKATEAEYTCNGTKLSFRIAGSVRCVRD